MSPPQEAPDADFEAEEEEDPEEVEPWISSDSENPEPWIPSDPEDPEPWDPSDSEPEPDQSEQEQQQQQAPPLPPKGEETSVQAERLGEDARQRWPGWPGTSVFRLVVPSEKVGGLIGRGGETIKRLCEETRARIRILDAAHGAAHRIVLVSATEEVKTEISPAMNAAIRIFKHINEIERIDSDGLSATAPKFCSVRLLVPSVQAVHVIGKQGSTIKSIKDSTGATIRIVDKDELLGCERVDERIVDIHGASLEVYNAVKSVLGLLRKFLVDQGVLHLFETKIQAVAQPQDTYNENRVIDDYNVHLNREVLSSDERSYGNTKGHRLSYERDLSFSDSYSSHVTDSIITQVTQTMQIPLTCAEDIIGDRGHKIEFIRSVSGAVVTLEESRHFPSEALVMIKGHPSQVQMAQQLVQEVLSEHREPPPWSRFHGVDARPVLLSYPVDTPACRDFPSPFREDRLPRNCHGHSTRPVFRATGYSNYQK